MAHIEYLEPRRLCSATTLKASRLTVYGSDAADAITVYGSGRAPTNKIAVSVNGVLRYFPRLAVTRLRILGEGGVDDITLDNLYDPNLTDVVIQVGDGGGVVGDHTQGTDYNRTERVSILGGSGDDSLIGGARAVLVDGGPGNDTVSGGASGGLLEGGDGNDVVSANILDPYGTLTQIDGILGYSRVAPQNLTLSGGAGDDTIVGNSLDLPTGDRLSGGDGNDTFYNYNEDTFVDFGDGDDVRASLPPVGNVEVTQSATLVFHVHETYPIDQVVTFYPTIYAEDHGFQTPIFVSGYQGELTMMGPAGRTYLLGDLLTEAGYPASAVGIPSKYSLTVNGFPSTLSGRQIAGYQINNGDVLSLDFNA